MSKALELLALKEVVKRTSIGKTKIYEWMKEGRFPKSYEIAPGMVRWRSDEIDAWINSRTAVRAA